MKKNQQKVGAVIVAAGESRRMEGIDKILALLDGEPILMRATKPFQECPLIHQIVVVVSREKEEKCRHVLIGTEWSKVSDICIGGRRRQDSVLEGLKRLKGCDWVIIHDGARPLVTVDLIEKGLEVAKENGAAAAALPVTSTIKVVYPDEIVLQTPPRQNLRVVQTPQVFSLDIIKKAYQKTIDAPDDAALVEQAGFKVKLYPGSYDNIKVTIPEDLALAELLWRKREK